MARYLKHVLFFVFMTEALFKAFACTSIIVSGRSSSDGRPFIFKNRDAVEKDEVVIYGKGEIYDYIALVNADDILPKMVSSGYNKEGFAIINAVANNMNGDKKDLVNNTIILKRALEICATLKDFETLLDTLPKPLHADSNFGVMDAEGGIAYYEVGNEKFVKYDANDPSIAPDGYLIRSNFAMSGAAEFGKGYERYKAMEEFIRSKTKKGKIRFEDVIRGATRYLKHGETKVNLWNYEPENGGVPVFVDFKDFIPRIVTVSAQLIQGVKKKQNPKLTTAWTICGSPLTTICIPVWMTKNHSIPGVLSRNEEGRSMLCNAGLELKKRLFPNSKKRKVDDINIAQLINKSGSGILQKLLIIEDEIFRRARKVQRILTSKRNADTDISMFYNWVDMYIPKEYESQFGYSHFSAPHFGSSQTLH